MREPAPAHVDELPTRARADGARRPTGTSLVEAVVIGFIAVSCGLSPFLYGFYDVAVWGPIALGMLAALLGLLIARPAAPRRGALLAAGALAAIWLWALASTGWAESADQAMTEANRWLLYAALFGVLVLLLQERPARRGRGRRRGSGDRGIRDLPAGTDARGLCRGAVSSPAGSTSRSGTSTARPATC